MTIKDIAKDCGVSVSTVSRVLNNRPVSPELRERVLASIKSSRYIPNVSAQDLGRNGSADIGLVIRGLGNPFFTEVICSLQRAAGSAGCRLLMEQLRRRDDELRRAALLERGKKLRGLILLGGRSDYSEEELQLLHVPFVCCGFRNVFGAPPPAGCASVSIDDRAAAREAVERLCSLGHRHIAALIAEAGDRSVSQLRYMGYVEALEARGLVPDSRLVVSAHSFEMKAAYEATQRLLRRNRDFTALFVITDSMAAAAVKALTAAGRRVPEDCSVIAIDGLRFTEYLLPTLSTLCQPIEELGRSAIAALLDILEGRSGPAERILPTVFRAGGSLRRLED